MYTISNFQEAVQQGGGMGVYVWVALIIFFLMVFLGWLAATRGWLKKDEAPVVMDHGHDSHDHDAHGAPGAENEHPAESQHLESAHGMTVPMDDEVLHVEAEPDSPAPAVPAVVAEVSEPVKITPVNETPAPTKSGPDDLTILEGIGPKVAKVLAGVGITTFAGLAKAEFSTVRNALDAAGYKYMEPAGWIEQAAIAAKGDMEGLKKLQGEMKGGRRIQ